MAIKETFQWSEPAMSLLGYNVLQVMLKNQVLISDLRISILNTVRYFLQLSMIVMRIYRRIKGSSLD